MASAPLAQNQRLIAELAEQVPSTGQHASVLEVPAGSHAPSREVEALQALVERFEVFRLRVCDDLASAEVVPSPDAVALGAGTDLRAARAEARAFLSRPIMLRREAPWQFLVLPLREPGGGHLVAIKASHMAGDAPSRYTFIRERSAATSSVDVPAAGPVDREWRRYQEWEARRVHDLDVAASLEPLAGGAAWDFGAGPRGPHRGMRLGDVRRHPAPAWAVAKGRRAISLFVTALGRLALRTGRSAAPLVAVPHSLRRQSGCLEGMGDFVDHLVVPVPHDGTAVDMLEACDRHLQRELAQAVPLRLRLAAAGHAVGDDPSPFTQAIVSFQPSSDVAPPYLLALPDELHGAPGRPGERVLPPDVGVIPLERQDISVMGCVHRGELRWRLSTRNDVVGESDHRDLEPVLDGEVRALAAAPWPVA